MKRGTPAHPKTVALASLLKISRCHAVGVLEGLWHFSAQYARRGDVGRHSDQAIAGGIGWDGDPVELIQALVATRWLVECDCHRLRIHDWPEHADQAVNKTKEVRTHGFLECYETRPTPGRPRSAGLQVYFVQAAGASGLIKIGSSVDPAARLKDLQIGSGVELKLLRVLPGGHLEDTWHAAFEHLRVRGEWFQPGPDLLEAIQRGDILSPEGVDPPPALAQGTGHRATAQGNGNGVRPHPEMRRSSGGCANPFVQGRRAELEAELERLVRQIAAAEERDATEIQAELSRYQGRSVANPRRMTDDRLVQTLNAARARVGELPRGRDQPPSAEVVRAVALDLKRRARSDDPVEAFLEDAQRVVEENREEELIR